VVKRRLKVRKKYGQRKTERENRLKKRNLDIAILYGLFLQFREGWNNEHQNEFNNDLKMVEFEKKDTLNWVAKKYDVYHFERMDFKTWAAHFNLTFQIWKHYKFEKRPDYKKIDLKIIYPDIPKEKRIQRAKNDWKDTQEKFKISFEPKTVTLKDLIFKCGPPKLRPDELPGDDYTPHIPADQKLKSVKSSIYPFPNIDKPSFLKLRTGEGRRVIAQYREILERTFPIETVKKFDIKYPPNATLCIFKLALDKNLKFNFLNVSPGVFSSLQNNARRPPFMPLSFRINDVFLYAKAELFPYCLHACQDVRPYFKEKGASYDAFDLYRISIDKLKPAYERDEDGEEEERVRRQYERNIKSNDKGYYLKFLEDWFGDYNKQWGYIKQCEWGFFTRECDPWAGCENDFHYITCQFELIQPLLYQKPSNPFKNPKPDLWRPPKAKVFHWIQYFHSTRQLTWGKDKARFAPKNIPPHRLRKDLTPKQRQHIIESIYWPEVRPPRELFMAPQLWKNPLDEDDKKDVKKFLKATGRALRGTVKYFRENDFRFRTSKTLMQALDNRVFIIKSLRHISQRILWRETGWVFKRLTEILSMKWDLNLLVIRKYLLLPRTNEMATLRSPKYEGWKYADAPPYVDLGYEDTVPIVHPFIPEKKIEVKVIYIHRQYHIWSREGWIPERKENFQMIGDPDLPWRENKRFISPFSPDT
jgi:hypothetical protein